MPRSVADLVSDLRHAAALDGAARTGQAEGGERLRVRVGLWPGRGAARRARFRATTCASLLAYAEAACALLEAGTPPGELTPALLRAQVTGVHPVHLDRADLVAAAVRAAAAEPEGSSA
ncbi:DUF732 domain-containing protein [Anaeromyxobacter sp. PSR-1]|uniref:DUF732 domain-containing protein n=1 Tax=unclassified Anaeromyxobacter TaxID=2620896 RepID=UPI0005DC7862|nr:DUF732 domain-containing protein [Anaeromyxobacter sp. PSR-1]GAO02916.1 hypothetical protein PSR1_01793 [Anaeromyxobacter sp. PSR-1]